MPAIGPGRLAAALRAHGHLPCGDIAAVEVVKSFETPPSTVVKLAVAYSADAPASAPRRLFVKAPKPHKLHRGRREVRFYTEVAPLMPGVPLPRCFGVVEEPASGVPALLLEDLSGTHAGTEWPVPRASMEGMLDALARLHAAWWDHPHLVEAAGADIADDLQAIFARGDHYWSQLAPALHERFSTEACRAYEHWFEAAQPLLLARATGGRDRTLCHPDSHYGNFLLPRTDGTVYIVDWHGYRTGWGAQDVAMLIARSQPPEQLADGGYDLVRFYHERLLGHGVTGYAWDSCWQDYRLEAIANLFWNHLMWIVPKLDVVLQVWTACRCAELFG